MDRALFSWRARTRRRRLAHSFACALCAQHVVSDTRRNCACEKFKAAVARVCARASYHASPHTNVCVRVYVRTRRVSLALMYLLFFPSILFPRFHCLALSFSPSLSPLSLSLSLQLTTRQRLLTLACWPWVSAAWFVTLAGGRYGIRKYLTGIRRLHLIKFIDTRPDIFHFFFSPSTFLPLLQIYISTFPCNEGELKKLTG